MKNSRPPARLLAHALAITCLALLWPSVERTRADGEADILTVSITTSNSVYASAEDVHLDIQVSNISSNLPYAVAVDRNTWHDRVAVTRNGSPLAMVPKEFLPTDFVTLNPSDTVLVTVPFVSTVLSLAEDLEALHAVGYQGSYIVTVTVAGVTSTSAAFTITGGPP